MCRTPNTQRRGTPSQKDEDRMMNWKGHWRKSDAFRRLLCDRMTFLRVRSAQNVAKGMSYCLGVVCGLQRQHRSQCDVFTAFFKAGELALTGCRFFNFVHSFKSQRTKNYTSKCVQTIICWQTNLRPSLSQSIWETILPDLPEVHISHRWRIATALINDFRKWVCNYNWTEKIPVTTFDLLPKLLQFAKVSE